MSLHGSLETFALPDVLTLLSSTKKSGELRVTGPNLDGRVWVQDGQLVGSAAGRASDHVDAVFELLRLTDGAFAFEQDQAAPSPQRPTPLEPVLAAAQSRLIEWREIEAVVPSLEAAVRLVPEVPGPEVVMSAEQWRLVVAAAEHRTVDAIGAALGFGQFDACRAVKELVDAGLASVAGRPAPAAVVIEETEPEPVAVVEESEPVREPEPLVADELDDDPLPAGLVQMVATTDEPAAEFEGEEGGEINRGLLLKFLSSVRS